MSNANWFATQPRLGEWLAWSVIRQLHDCADLTVVTSPQMKAEFEAHGVQRVEVWNKGIDTHVFHPKHGAKAWWRETHAHDEGDDPAELAAAAREMRERLTGGEPQAPLLIYVGRLGVEKRLRDLRDVLAKLPGARLAFVGKGPDMDGLREYFDGESVKKKQPRDGTHTGF